MPLTKHRSEIDMAVRALMIIAIAIITLMMIIAAGYSYLCEDDFSWVCGIRDIISEHGGNQLTASVRGTLGHYFSNEGAYLGAFCAYFLNPYEFFGLPGFSFVMILNVFCYVGAFYFLICNLVEETNIRLLFLLSVLLVSFCTFFSNGCVEWFVWFTGVAFYTIGFDFTLISLGLFIRMIKNKPTVPLLVLTSLTCVFAAGGKICLAPVHCSLMLIVVIMCWHSMKKYKSLWIPFGVSVIFTLVNVLSPGQYNRANSHTTEGHSSLADAINDTFSCFVRENINIFKSALFISILILLFLTAIFWGKYISNKKISVLWMILSWIAALAVQLVLIFPIAYGNHTDVLDSARLVQSVYLVMSLMYMFSSVMTGLCIGRFEFGFKKFIIPVGIVLIVVLVAIPKTDTSDIKNGYISKVVRDCISGNLSKNYTVRSHILTSLSMAEEDSDVILFLPYYPCESTYGMGIDENPDSFVNDSVRNWTRIHSLTVYYLGFTYPIG